jgi:hypothetical protein
MAVVIRTDPDFQAIAEQTYRADITFAENAFNSKQAPSRHQDGKNRLILGAKGNYLWLLQQPSCMRRRK